VLDVARPVAERDGVADSNNQQDDGLLQQELLQRDLALAEDEAREADEERNEEEEEEHVDVATRDSLNVSIFTMNAVPCPNTRLRVSMAVMAASTASWAVTVKATES
jgi:hypothetical protein